MLSLETKNKVIESMKKQAYNSIDESGILFFIWKGKKYTITTENIGLEFSVKNSKLVKQSHDYQTLAVVLDMLSGTTCPGALFCKVTAIIVDGYIGKRVLVKGKHNKYNCFAADDEVQYMFTFLRRWINTEVVKYASQAEIESEIVRIIESAPKKLRYATKNLGKVGIMRYHGAGDFFMKKYFMAAVNIAKMYPEIKFYGYTKVLPYVQFEKPDNFGLVYSDGGKFDDKVDENTPQSIVAFPGQTKVAPFACETIEDDFEFILAKKSFMLHLH